MNNSRRVIPHRRGLQLQKRGGYKFSSLEDLRGDAAPLVHRGLGVGAADACGGEDPHRGL
jgi:hypothetical protein